MASERRNRKKVHFAGATFGRISAVGVTLRRGPIAEDGFMGDANYVLTQQIAKLEKQVAERDKQIAELKKQVAERDKKVAELERFKQSFTKLP